jgi:hypothetical protein
MKGSLPMTDIKDYRGLADGLAAKAKQRTGEEYATDAAGEGLAAVAYALLGSLPNRRSPQVWLEVNSADSEARMVVRADRIIGARVHAAAPEEERFFLEVFVPEMSDQSRAQWLVVAEGRGEWFELNAAERLLLLLAETARDEDVPAIILTVHGLVNGKDELSVDWGY